MRIGSIAWQLLRNSLANSTELGASQNEKRSASQLVDLVNQRGTAKAEQSYFGRNPSFEPSFEFVARYSTADVYEQTDVIEKRDVFETRPIYEDQAILETKVEGSKDLSVLDSLDEAGIAKGARFSVTVGDDPKAKFKFDDASTISVKVDGSVEEFSFGADDGSFRTGLLDALNSIDGLSASHTEGSRLSLETDDGASLTLTDIRKSPLANLGLPDGTTNGEVTGYEHVQVGTEQVKVGEKTVVVGKEILNSGTKQVLDGYKTVVTGLERSDLFDTESLVSKIADDDSITSPKKYAETLFGVVKAAEDGNDAFTSSAEAKSAYDATLSEADPLSGEEADDSSPQANRQIGWL